MGKLINRIPGSRLLISSLPSLAMSTSVLKALPGKLDIKRHSPSILYILHPLGKNVPTYHFKVKSMLKMVQNAVRL